MAHLYELLPRVTQLELALQTQNPGSLARTFAGFVGTFYCRSDFDSLAREVSELLRLIRTRLVPSGCSSTGDCASASTIRSDGRSNRRQEIEPHEPVAHAADGSRAS
jgi:hypothetical protein